MKKAARWRMVVFCLLFLTGCNGDGDDAPPAAVEIQSITADPAVVRPGESTVLTVSATDGAGNPLTFRWEASAGSLNAADTNPVTWTAPPTIGTAPIQVEVSNGETRAVGFASVLVSVSPAGPIITNVSPAEVKAGDELRVNGAGFGSSQGSGSLTIGGMPVGSILSWSETEIRAVVPEGAATGAVIATAAGVASSPGHLVVLWKQETPENVAIATAAGNQNAPRLISDGAGGGIIVWSDFRGGPTSDIYAQRVDLQGVVQWAADGVVIAATPNTQQNSQLASDGAGGAIIVWEDFRNEPAPDLFAQRINSAGAVQWAANGIPISVAANGQSVSHLIPDGTGGAIIAWQDERAGSADIYAQRVDANGAVLWTVNGAPISTAAGVQSAFRMVPDSAGGAILVWTDARNPANIDLYAQRVNGDGSLQWQADGLPISAAAGTQGAPQLISDGAGGAILVWEDARLGGTPDIYGQRVDAAGIAQWTANGVVISAAAGSQSAPRLASDGSGGAIVAWEDARSGQANIYAQRVSANGATQWESGGVLISGAIGGQAAPQLVPDGAGGAILVWEDGRNGANIDLYAQRVNSGGAVQWIAGGLPVSAAAFAQNAPQVVLDGSGGAVIAWTDSRNGSENTDIFVQGLSASGRQ